MAASKRRRSAPDSSLFDYRNLEPRHLLSVSLPGGVNLVSNSTLTPLAESDTNFYSNEEVEGWNAVNAEAGQQLHLLKFSHQREFVLNLDATAGHFDQVFQDLATREGIEYTLAFDLRERPVAVDAAESTNDVEVLWNDESLGTFRGTQQWQTVALTVTGRADMSRLEFREVGQDEQDLGDGRGPLIDNVIATRMHTGFVANGSFELVADKSGELHHQSTVDGWQAMGSYDDRVMKIVQSAEATEGAGVLALDSSAERLDRLYQDLATEPDRKYYLSFDIKGADEPGMDNELRIRWNGQWAGSFVGTSDWQTYGLLLEADSELTRLVLRETAGGEMGKGDGHGPLLDNIRIDKVDQLPQIPAIADAVITQGEEFRLDIAASDPDGTPLTYEITGSGEPLSEGMDLPYIAPGGRGGMLWRPGGDGVVDLTYTVTDNFGVPVTQNFSLTVERNADVPPDFEPFSWQRQLSNVKPELRNGLYDQAPQMSIDTAKEYEAIFQTADGQIRVLLNDDQAPITVNNFVNLALDGYYDGLTFHRVVDLGPGFIAQGGDPTGFGAGGPGYQFADEATALGEFDRRDLLAMANAGPNTNGSQFFFTLSPQTQLNGQHAIFGEVIEGSDVVDAINRRVVGSTTPAEQIYSVTILEDGREANYQMDFSIYFKKNGKIVTDNTFTETRTFRTVCPNSELHNWQFDSSTETISNTNKFLEVENFRFIVDPKIDLSQYTLGVIFNNVPGQALPFKESWLSIGADSMAGNIINKVYSYVEFELWNSNIIGNVTGGDQKAKGVKQFTFIPWDQNLNDQYFGKRAVVITFGPQNYTSDSIGDPTQKEYVIQSSKIKEKMGPNGAKIGGLGWQIKNGRPDLVGLDLGGHPGWLVAIGGLADQLLNMGLKDGPDINSYLYHLKLDKKIDTDVQLLSQSIVVKYTGNDHQYQNYKNRWTPILLENDRQWVVTGDGYNGVIDGTKRAYYQIPYDTKGTPAAEKDAIRFENIMLELQSSYNSNKFGPGQPMFPAHDGTQRSIAVAGVTFQNNPKRNQSGIQLNFNDSYAWWVNPDPNNPDQTYSDRIWTAISNFTQNGVGTPASQYFNNGGQLVAPVWMFDNQMFTWTNGSDGPEVRSPYSYFDRNYQMTPDDNLKVLSSHSIWNDMTLIQGNTGSAVSFASYGFTNGAVQDNHLGTVSIPRIAQATQFDGINGVISNKSCFGQPLQNLAGDKNGIFNNTIDELKVDQWVKFPGQKIQLDQNGILDAGVFSALNYNGIYPEVEKFTSPSLKTDFKSFGISGNNFKALYFPSTIFENGVKQLLYAFGKSEKNQQGGVDLSGVHYSGNTWRTTLGDKTIPYFAEQTEIDGFIIDYKYTDPQSGVTFKAENYIDLKGNTAKYYNN